MRVMLAILLTLVAANSIPGRAAQRVQRLLEGMVLPDYGSDWYTVPTSINNRDEIAGYAIGADDELVAFVRSPSGHDQAIAENAITHDLNDRGDVIGVHVPCDGDNCRVEGFAWSRARGLRSLGSFFPYAVNDSGDMAGVCDEPWRACVMRDGVVSEVSEPGSEARGINARGEVVGAYGDNRAFHLTPDWQLNDIGRGAAEDINDRGVIAGQRFRVLQERGERGVATAWTKRGPRSPGLEASTAIAINNKGWVIANAWDENEQSYSFIWDPATNRRVMLTSADGGWVYVEDVNDRGSVVGTAGTHGALWRVRQREMVGPSR